MAEEMTCGWEVDHRDRRPVLCGRPAKAQAVENLGAKDQLVCGVHARSARALGYDVTDLPGPDVRPGQVWADNDPRVGVRHVRVVEVDGTHATVVQTNRHGMSTGSTRFTRIRLDRFRPTSTGYRLVTDVPKEG